MTKDSEKSEPSMDDILASIRKIIDEDGSKTRKPAASPSGQAASDILELTEMVNEDGSVTSLQEAQEASADLTPKPVDDDEPAIYDDDHQRERPTVFSSAEPARPTLAGDPKPAVPAMDQAPSQPTPPPPPQPPRILPTPSLGGISLTPVNTPPQPPVQPQSSQSGLVSGQTANAASAAFDRLAQAALQQQAPAAPKTPSPTIGGRALEDMVAEMLKPMLQQWLDTNLPSIVERLVQQEIQKMSRR